MDNWDADQNAGRGPASAACCDSMLPAGAVQCPLLTTCSSLLPGAQSLPGHVTPVDSVTFDRSEEVVAAGATSGSIKVYDLDQAKGVDPHPPP